MNHALTVIPINVLVNAIVEPNFIATRLTFLISILLLLSKFVCFIKQLFSFVVTIKLLSNFCTHLDLQIFITLCLDKNELRKLFGVFLLKVCFLSAHKEDNTIRLYFQI